jgi:hypothetical protein
MVAAVITVGAVVAATVTPPSDVPVFALQASAVYRVEVGGAVFLGLYVATMTFVLALRNRGFTDIGSGGFRTQDLSTVSQEEVFQEVAMEVLSEIADEVHDLQTLRRER